MNSSTGRKDMRAEPEPGAGPGGLQPPPRRAPRRLQTTGDLRALQRLMAHAIVLGQCQLVSKKATGHEKAGGRQDKRPNIFLFIAVKSGRDEQPELKQDLGEARKIPPMMESLM